MSRLRYIVNRFAVTVALLFLILSFLFLFFRALPGSYTNILVAQGASPESVAALEQRWGLNEPIYIQYIRYIVNFVQLDIGTSFQNSQPVWEFVRPKLFNTFILVAPGITFAYVVGSIYGTYLGTTDNEVVEDLGPVPLIFFGSFPEFFIAIFLIFIFAGIFDIFPTSGILTPSVRSAFVDAPWWRPYLTLDFAAHYVLPFTAVVMRYLFFPTLIMRTNVAEVLDQDFTHYMRISGLSERTRFRHMLKHASLPVITLYPVSMTRAIGGLVLIESVFNWPGIGAALVAAVLARDFPVVQFVFFLVAAFVVISNFLVDIVYGWVDPRVSVGGNEG
ncbi:ABC transporter permease [Haloarcula marina]|uniref:ABC transporter permease n=1 Tax=Haloarcula marina TaxID=2961574 RepID=UPI0020B86F7F|nr:ABC transporter permease [Halomicroarcula marina]